MKANSLTPKPVRASVRLRPTHTRVRPAVYVEGTGSDMSPTLVLEERYVEGKPVQTILLDSVPSMANRMEELLHARRERLGFDDIAVKIPVNSPSGERQEQLLSQWQLPHRLYDALVRDSLLDGQPFFSTPLGSALARGEVALLFRYAPNVYLFGAWNSHAQAGIGARLAPRIERALVTEVYGLEPRLLSRPGGRRDPLGIPGDLPLQRVPAYQERASELGANASKLSELGFGNIPPSLESLEVSLAEARLDFLLTPIPWRQRGLPEEVQRVLFLTGLLGLALLLKEGYLHLRSGTTLQVAEEVVLELGGEGLPLPSPEELEEVIREALPHLPEEYRWRGETVTLEPIPALRSLLEDQEALRQEARRGRSRGGS